MTYDVYLGENNTSNFDVRRNTVQTLDIRIKGDNEIDARIHSFEVKISDDLPDADFSRAEDRCIYATGKKLSIAVMDREKAGDLSAKIRLVSGARGALQISGHSVTSDIAVPLGGSSDVYEIPIAYDPGTVYTKENSRLRGYGEQHGRIQLHQDLHAGFLQHANGLYLLVRPQQHGRRVGGC